MYRVLCRKSRLFRGKAVAATALLLAAGFARADAGLLRVLVDDSTEMPMAEIVDGRVVAGVHRDLGVLLATALRRRPGFIVRPRNRVAQALVRGEADIICAYAPPWLPGPFLWSGPVLAQNEIVITPLGSPDPKVLENLAGQRIGTVLGFRYPEIEKTLRDGFVRDDAPQARNNLQKLMAGRIAHAVVGEIYLDYQIKLQQFTMALHPRIVSSSVRTACALSPLADISLKRLDDVISSLQRTGKLAALLQRYR